MHDAIRDPGVFEPVPQGGQRARGDSAVVSSRRKEVSFREKLWQRLLFERSVVALYDSLLDRHALDGPLPGGPIRKDIAQIREDEHGHTVLLSSALESIGFSAVGSSPPVATPPLRGIVLAPHTGLVQFLHAALAFELSDGDGWTGLIDLARDVGRDDLENHFVDAALAEEEHRSLVGCWLDVVAPMN